jgi:hypothetical protein
LNGLSQLRNPEDVFRIRRGQAETAAAATAG